MATDIQVLVDQFIADPSPRRREAVVLSAVPLVHSILGKIPTPDHPLASEEDLESAGLLGLIEALDQYDPKAGTRFSTYAYLRVRGHIVDYLRSLDVLSQKKREKMAEAAEVADRLRQRLGQEPTERQVAAELGVSIHEYDSLLCQAQLRYALGLDDSVGNDEGDFTLHDLLADEGAQDAFTQTEDDMTLGLVRRVIEGLSSRERAIVALYYEEELTLSEVGEVMGISKGRVSQILGKVRLQIHRVVEGERAA